MKVKALCVFVLLAAAGALAGCGGNPASSGILSPLQQNRSTTFQFVGYWDGWQQNNLVNTPQGVNAIPIAFGYLRGHTITMSEITQGYVTAKDIAALHARGVKVTLSLGGWSPKNSFVFDGDVQGFENSLRAVLAKLPFDGVDFDEEHGTTQQRIKDLTTLIPATRSFFNSLGQPGAVVTYPAWNRPGDYGDGTILKNANVVAALSWVNVMSHENNDVARTESDLEAYGAIFDKHRLMLGVDIDDAPIPTNASLQALSSWVRTNAYGGMMAWTVNSITAGQMNAITGTPSL
ncbi:MAG TPA: glycoside hydrolase family 18 protein [Candidatus Baltobacteraceae bacterium]|jgi:hypothetical protein|nr:glycoside hydrolase family 18 protein [Candidatus Baltobacteraceae bacterium]